MVMFCSSFLTKIKPRIGGCWGINTNLVLEGLPWPDLSSYKRTAVRSKMSILCACMCVCKIFFVPAQVTDVMKRTSQHRGHDLKFQNRTSHLTFDLLTEDNHQHKENPKDFCKFLINTKSVNLSTPSISALNSINIIHFHFHDAAQHMNRLVS
jgi:hypothetical protein